MRLALAGAVRNPRNVVTKYFLAYHPAFRWAPDVFLPFLLTANINNNSLIESVPPESLFHSLEN